MKHREFITADFAGLSESERADASILLGGSAAEYVLGDRDTPETIPAVVGSLGITESEWRDPVTHLTVVLRVGDAEAVEILSEIDRLRAGTESKVLLPYTTTFVMGRNVVETVVSPDLSASVILETEARSMEERRREADEWRAEHGPAPELSDIPPEEANLADIPWGEDTRNYVEQKQLEAMQPMRALVLPWDEVIAEELYVRNAYSELGDRRLPFFIVGKRVYTVGVGMHLNMQP